jgi:DNA helicase-2/ATP-dependent DNA helicase PcrA
MTLHTAKGLEWPVVVMSGMEDGLFPMSRAMETPDGLEEERRLCYVGITRARDSLILTWARSRRRGGELRPGMPSRFLRELPPEVVDERRTSFAVGGGMGRSWSGSGQYGGTRGGSSGWGGGSTRRKEPPPIATPRAGWDEFSQAPAAAEAAAQHESQDAPRFLKGERVRHRRFGSGVILGLSGNGKDTKVSVAFDDQEIGTKQLLVAFAGLERDWESA